MSFLFDYQINYYSDSDDITQLPFSIFALTQQGLEHQRLNIGNQDSGSLYLGKRVLIGAVADGCTGGKNINRLSNNQVGASISSYLTVRLLRKLVVKKKIGLKDLLPEFEQELLFHYKRLLNTLNPWKFEKSIVIKNMFLSTIIFFIITENEYLVANCGDGDVIINGSTRKLDDQNSIYFAKNLTEIKRNQNGNYFINPIYSFKTIAIGNSSELNSLFIATDGFLDDDIEQHPAFSKFFLEGTSEENFSGFRMDRAEFRTDFLTPIMEMKDGLIYPHDDATFISLNRVHKS